MLSYERAIEIITDYISDMPDKDKRAVISGLLAESYDGDLNRLIDEWDLENRDIWKIKEYIDEKNTD